MHQFLTRDNDNTACRFILNPEIMSMFVAVSFRCKIQTFKLIKTYIDMRTFNPVRCERRVRDSFVDKWGRTITLTGQHAFGYNVVIQDKNKDTSFPYPCGIEARKAFNELKKVR